MLNMSMELLELVILHRKTIAGNCRDGTFLKNDGVRY